jgi:hypothetical protein
MGALERGGPHPRGCSALERGGPYPRGRSALEQGGPHPRGRSALEQGGPRLRGRPALERGKPCLRGRLGQLFWWAAGATRVAIVLCAFWACRFICVCVFRKEDGFSLVFRGPLWLSPIVALEHLRGYPLGSRRC